MGKPANVVQFLIGFALGGIGLLIGGIAVVGLLDPVGSKMADDADPFGPTDGYVLRGIVLLIGSIAIIATGAFLIWRIDKKQ